MWRERFARLGRGSVGRCPNCGARGVFSSYFTLRERCPVCGLGFEREEGYWLGAMVVNLGVTEALFGVLFIGGMLLTWPEVPWTLLLVAGIVLNATVPVVYYPLSKTTWMGIDLFFNPPSPAEEADAITAREAGETASGQRGGGPPRDDWPDGG